MATKTTKAMQDAQVKLNSLRQGLLGGMVIQEYKRQKPDGTFSKETSLGIGYSGGSPVAILVTQLEVKVGSGTFNQRTMQKWVLVNPEQ